MATLIEYLTKRLGVPTGNGPEYQFYCPACIDRHGSESSKRKLGLNIVLQRGQCWRCEFKFRRLAYLFRYLNGGFLTIQEKILLKEDPPIPLESVRKTVVSLLRTGKKREAPLRRRKLPDHHVQLTRANIDRPALRRAGAYLRRRKVPLERALAFQLGFCTSGEYAGYLVFPVFQGGELVYWTTRYCGKHFIKSKNPPKEDGAYSREHCLLNYDNVIGEPVVSLVEGGFDCMIPTPAVGLMGKVMNPVQARLFDGLVEYGLEELVITLDPGTGAAVDEIRDELSDRVPKVSVVYLGHGDPAERAEEMPELLLTRRQPTLRDRVASRFRSG